MYVGNLFCYNSFEFGGKYVKFPKIQEMIKVKNRTFQ